MIGLAKDFALSRIEKKLAAKAKEAERIRKAQQKAIDETDPWHQYREQSEKMEHIRIQTQRMKQSAVHDARNQTAVLDTSSHDDGLGASDQTFWAKHLTKSEGDITPNTPSDQNIDRQFRQSFSQVQHDGMGASFGGGLSSSADNKKYYDLGDLKTLDDYLDNPFASPKTIFSVTTPDKKVYTLIPHANAAASPNITYTDLSLIGETGLGLAIRYGVPIARTLAPYAARSLGIIGTVLVAKEAAEFAWEGTKELAKYVFAPDPALESFIYDSTKHLSVSYIKGKENTVKASLAATREIDLDTCHMMRDWSFLQKFQYFADKAEFWGNIYLNPRSLPWLDGTAKHRILHYQIKEYNFTCKDMSIRSEIVVLDGEIYLNGRPASIKGASIVDGITSDKNKQGYWEVADFKSGILGITDEKAEKLGINMREKQFKLYDVRASSFIYGPTREFDLTSLKLKQ